MKRLTWVAILPLLSCAGWRSLDRGEWVLVWTDESVTTQIVNGTPIEVVKPTPGARQEVISLERYDSEISDGKRRGASGALGEVPKHANKIESPIELMVNEVREIIVDETQEATVLIAGDAVKSYWTKRKDASDWKDGQAIERKESSLFLLADEPGSAKVKVMYGEKDKDAVVIEVQVHAK